MRALIPAAAAALAALAVPALAQPPGGGMARADNNGDGKVSYAEFSAAQRTRMMRADANRDGKLTLAEVQAAAGRMGGAADKAAGPGAGGMMQRMLPMLDADKNGVISPAEMERAARMRFSRMDANADNVLAGAELQPRGPRPGA